MSTGTWGQLSIAELAEDAFLKAEYVKSLELMNTPTELDERKKAFIQLAQARVAAARAQSVLDGAISEARRVDSLLWPGTMPPVPNGGRT